MNREDVRDVCVRLAAEPWQLIRCWNWKTALLSSVFRAHLFFAVNWTSGPEAAVTAMLTQLGFRAFASGFCGAVIQSFRLAEPRWAANLIIALFLPLLIHSAEVLIHWFAATPALALSIAVSVSLTVLSATFHLFAMRRDVLIVGRGSPTLTSDLRQAPGLVWLFIRTGAGVAVR